MEGGCVRRLLQLCGQFDQQTTVAAAASAGLGVVGAGAALERGSGWRERHGVCLCVHCVVSWRSLSPSMQ